MENDSRILRAALDLGAQVLNNTNVDEFYDSEGFLDVNRTYQMLTLLSCFTKNVRGKIYNGDVTDSIKSTPSLVAKYFLEFDLEYSFERFLSLRRDLAVKVMEIFTIWLPDENWLLYALLELHDLISTAYSIHSLPSHEREFIEVDLQDDLSLIIKHYGYDPRDPDSQESENEEEEEEDDDDVADGFDDNKDAWILETIPEEEEIATESSEVFN